MFLSFFLLACFTISLKNKKSCFLILLACCNNKKYDTSFPIAHHEDAIWLVPPCRWMIYWLNVACLRFGQNALDLGFTEWLTLVVDKNKSRLESVEYAFKACWIFLWLRYWSSKLFGGKTAHTSLLSFVLLLLNTYGSDVGAYMVYSVSINILLSGFLVESVSAIWPWDVYRFAKL